MAMHRCSSLQLKRFSTKSAKKQDLLVTNVLQLTSDTTEVVVGGDVSLTGEK